MKISELKSQPIMILGIDPVKRDLPTLTDDEILAMQCPSMQAVIKEDSKFFEDAWEKAGRTGDATPNVKMSDYDMDTEEGRRAFLKAKTNERYISPQDIVAYESQRKVRQHSYAYKANLTTL